MARSVEAPCRDGTRLGEMLLVCAVRPFASGCGLEGVMPFQIKVEIQCLRRPPTWVHRRPPRLFCHSQLGRSDACPGVVFHVQCRTRFWYLGSFHRAAF